MITFDIATTEALLFSLNVCVQMFGISTCLHWDSVQYNTCNKTTFSMLNSMWTQEVDFICVKFLLNGIDFITE